MENASHIFLTESRTNVSSELHRNETITSTEEYADILEVIKVVNVVIIPASIVLGLLGNSFTIIIMNSTSFSKLSARFFLISLALSDTVVILTQPFNKMFVIDYFGTDIRALSSFSCKLSIWIFRTAKMLSSWFVVCICIERFIAVVFPFKVKLLITKRNCLTAIGTLLLVLGSYNAGWSYSSDILPSGLCSSEYFDKNNKNAVMAYRIMLFLGFSFLALIPVMILVILTPIIITSLTQQMKQRRRLSMKSKTDSQGTKASTMLLTVIIAFVLLATPYAIFRNVAFFMGKDAQQETSNLFKIARDTTHTLEQLNYILNFFLYVLTSKQYRSSMASLFCACKCRRGL